MNIRFYRSNTYDPYYNLALEEYLFETKGKESIILLWQNEKTVVVGRYQNTFDEVDLEWAKRNSINIVRRNTGGGAVYHDLGNLNYSFIVDRDSDDIDNFQLVLRNTLKEYGLEIELKGRNDITIHGYKISGTARYIERSRTLYHGTLLIDCNLSCMNRVLTRKGKISSSKAKQSIPKAVANINDFLAIHITVEDVIDRFSNILGVLPDFYNLSSSNIEELRIKKYLNSEWNYGFQPQFDYKSTKYFQGGTISINVKIRDGKMIDVQFQGDFFTKKDIVELEKAMIGMAVSSRLKEQLSFIGADNYFVGISSENIADLFADISLN